MYSLNTGGSPHLAVALATLVPCAFAVQAACLPIRKEMQMLVLFMRLLGSIVRRDMSRADWFESRTSFLMLVASRPMESRY